MSEQEYIALAAQEELRACKILFDSISTQIEDVFKEEALQTVKEIFEIWK